MLLTFGISMEREGRKEKRREGVRKSDDIIAKVEASSFSVRNIGVLFFVWVQYSHPIVL